MPSPSSPPTRIPLPRHLAQLSGPERSDTGTFSASAVSPQGSADYSRMNDTPEATFHDTSSVSSPTETKIVDPSMIAVHGSVPPSPILRAQRAGKLGKESSTFPPPRDTPEWNNEKAQDDLADQNPDAPPVQAGETAEAEAETTSSAVDIKRTANNSRVIAIDLEVIYPQHPPDNIQPIFGADIQLMEQSATSQVFSPVSPVSPTEMKGTTSGLLLAFKQLRALGHPLHLISTREAREKAEIEVWLEQQGIGIGTADEDVVAALWFTDAVLPMTEAVRFATLSGGRDRMGEAKLKVCARQARDHMDFEADSRC